jgi:hypothetical protein
LVKSYDNQTISHVILSIPSVSAPTPDGLLTINTVYGANEDACGDWQKGDTILTCDFGNFGAFGERSIAVVWDVAQSFDTSTTHVFTASVRTNEQLNPNGSNGQIYEATSGAALVSSFSDNALATFNLGGPASTSPLGSGDAGNLQTTVNLLQNNGGNGNVVQVSEGTDGVQPAYCVARNLSCQPDFTVVSVNGGSAVSPYLETVLTAKVPKTYNVKKAFVIHVLDDGSVAPGFPLFNVESTSCAGHPTLVPCADFSLTKQGILTVVVHTATNGKFNY